MHDVAEATQSIRSYNGWRNRETWVVNMWLNNDIGGYEMLRSICDTDEELYLKAEKLKHYVMESLDDMYDVSSMWLDLIHTSLGRVNWYEIVELN